MADEPRGLRNLNPLNIEAGPFALAQPGFAGSDGRFARFNSLDEGIGAADRLLEIYARKHGLNTVKDIVGRWAPSSDGNNVGAYAGSVAKQIGVDPAAPLDMSNPEVRRKLIFAMGQHENGRPITGGRTTRALNAPPAPAVSAAASSAPMGLAPPQADSGMAALIEAAQRIAAETQESEELPSALPPMRLGDFSMLRTLRG